jgi:hypothetical protein
VADEIARLDRRAARLWISSSVSGAMLWVDDERVGRLPLRQALRVNPGTHRLRVQKVGYPPATRTLVVLEGDRRRVSLRLAEESRRAGPGAPPVRDEPRPSADDTPLWIGVASLATTGAAALGLALWTRHENDRLEQELNRMPLRQKAVDDARIRVTRLAAATDVVTAAAALSALATAYHLLEPRAADRSRAAAKPAPSLSVGTDGSGLWLSGRF